MALTLTSNISSSDEVIRVTGTVTETPGYAFTIDNEAFRLRSYSSPTPAGNDTVSPVPSNVNYWRVVRGFRGTTAASHTAGASLTTIPPIPSAGGGGGGVTVTDGSVSVTASSIRVPLAVDEGSGVVLTSHLVIAASDPGAIGSGNFWLNPDVSGGSYGSPLPQLHVRNETDDDWYVVTAPIDASATGSQFVVTTGVDAYELSQTGGSIAMRSGDAARKIQLFSDGIEIKSDGYIVISNGLPTSDPGVAGQLYSDGVPSAGVPKALMVSGG